MKKVAVIGVGFGWKEIIQKLLHRGDTVDYYTYYPEQVDFDGINKVFVLTQEYKPKSIPSIKRVSDKIKELVKSENYDHVISTDLFIELGSNVAHFNSIVYRQSILNTPIERFFYYLAHKARIDYFKKWRRPEHEKMIVVSNNLKADYSSNCGIPEDKIIVAPPGHNVAEDIQSYKKTYNKDSEDFVFGASALGFKRKGGYLLLRTMFHLLKKHKNVKCRIIYPNHESNTFIKFVLNVLNLKDKVELVGYQNGMSDFYNSIHCLVMPSYHEAFGLVATEAMMYRKPVIVSSRSGVTDIITDGRNGFIFDITKNQTKNLMDKMEYVMQNYNNLDECIEKAFNSAKSLNWDNFAELIVNNL